MRFNLLLSVLFSFSAMAQIECLEVITKNGELVSPAKEDLSQVFFLGLDAHDIGIEIRELKQFYTFRNLDRSSVECVQAAGGANATTRFYEKDMIVAYTLYPDHVDYYVIIPRKGVDDVIFYRGSRKDYNRRSDDRIFFKKSSFADIESIKDARILERTR